MVLMVIIKIMSFTLDSLICSKTFLSAYYVQGTMLCTGISGEKYRESVFKELIVNMGQ